MAVLPPFPGRAVIKAKILANLRGLKGAHVTSEFDTKIPRRLAEVLEGIEHVSVRYDIRREMYVVIYAKDTREYEGMYEFSSELCADSTTEAEFVSYFMNVTKGTPLGSAFLNTRMHSLLVLTAKSDG